MHEGEAGVGGAESWQGAELVRVKEASRPCDGRQSDRHYPFEDFRDGFEEDKDAEGGRGVVGGLAGLVQDHSVGSFE